jgi:hypothetical protein
MKDPASARRLRMNCYTTRRRHALASQKEFPVGHPEHGKTNWDHIEIRLSGNTLTFVTGDDPNIVSIEEI